MYNVHLKILIKKGVTDKVFVIYLSSIKIKRKLHSEDLKLFYQKGMRYVLKNPTREQQVYRERFYVIDSINYFSAPLGKVSINNGPDSLIALQNLPQPFTESDTYNITFEVIYTLFQPEGVEYLRMENNYVD